jgi:FMN reductase
MSALLVLSGSPSASSRTARVGEHLTQQLSLTGFDVHHLDLRSLPPDALLAGETDHPEVRRALAEVERASGVVVATPVYKSAYTGLLKTFLDLLPQDGLAGKTVLPLATGGTVAHVLSIDYALRPVLASLTARHVVGGCFLLDRSIDTSPAHGVLLDPDSEQRLRRALDEFIGALPSGPALRAA